MTHQNTSSAPISSLWFTWYLLSDLEGQLTQARRATQVFIGTGVGVDVWERRMFDIATNLDAAIQHAQDAGIDTTATSPDDLLPLHTLPWPARGLHLWWSTREALLQAEQVTKRLRAQVAHELELRVGDAGPDASHFAKGDGSTSSRRGRGSVNPRSSSSRVIAAG